MATLVAAKAQHEAIEGEVMPAPPRQCEGVVGFVAALAKVGAKRPPKFIPAARLEEMMKAFASLSTDNIKEMEQVIETKYIKK